MAHNLEESLLHDLEWEATQLRTLVREYADDQKTLKRNIPEYMGSLIAITAVLCSQVYNLGAEEVLLSAEKYIKDLADKYKFDSSELLTESPTSPSLIT